MRKYNIAIIGNGRAGGAFSEALKAVGHVVYGPYTRGFSKQQDFIDCLSHVEVVIVATNDSNIKVVASELFFALTKSSLDSNIEPNLLVVHLSGAKSLEDLSIFSNKASMHPLAPLPNQIVGALRLRSNITYAVTENEIVKDLVKSLNGKCVFVDDTKRALYHTVASMASNFLVALMGEVSKLAEICDLSLDDFIQLSEFSIQDVKDFGIRAALTGPVVRNDIQTLNSHRVAVGKVGKEDLRFYDSGVKSIKSLVSMWSAEGLETSAKLQNLENMQCK